MVVECKRCQKGLPRELLQRRAKAMSCDYRDMDEGKSAFRTDEISTTLLKRFRSL